MQKRANGKPVVLSPMMREQLALFKGGQWNTLDDAGLVFKSRITVYALLRHKLLEQRGVHLERSQFRLTASGTAALIRLLNAKAKP